MRRASSAAVAADIRADAAAARTTGSGRGAAGTSDEAVRQRRADEIRSLFDTTVTGVSGAAGVSDSPEGTTIPGVVRPQTAAEGFPAAGAGSTTGQGVVTGEAGPVQEAQPEPASPPAAPAVTPAETFDPTDPRIEEFLAGARIGGPGQEALTSPAGRIIQETELLREKLEARLDEKLRLRLFDQEGSGPVDEAEQEALLAEGRARIDQQVLAERQRRAAHAVGILPGLTSETDTGEDIVESIASDLTTDIVQNAGKITRERRSAPPSTGPGQILGDPLAQEIARALAEDPGLLERLANDPAGGLDVGVEPEATVAGVPRSAIARAAADPAGGFNIEVVPVEAVVQNPQFVTTISDAVQSTLGNQSPQVQNALRNPAVVQRVVNEVIRREAFAQFDEGPASVDPNNVVANRIRHDTPIGRIVASSIGQVSPDDEETQTSTVGDNNWLAQQIGAAATQEPQTPQPNEQMDLILASPVAPLLQETFNDAAAFAARREELLPTDLAELERRNPGQNEQAVRGSQALFDALSTGSLQLFRNQDGAFVIRAEAPDGFYPVDPNEILNETDQQ